MDSFNIDMLSAEEFAEAHGLIFSSAPASYVLIVDGNRYGVCGAPPNAWRRFWLSLLFGIEVVLL